MKRTAAAIAAILPFAAFPLLIGPGGQHISTLGFIDLPDDWSSQALLAAGLTALIALVYVHPDRRGREPMLITTVTLLLVPVTVALVQIATTGGISYYFFKTLLGAAVFATALIVVGAVLMLERVRLAWRSRPLLPTLALAVLVTPVVCFGVNPAMRTVVAGHAPQQVLPVLHKGRVLMSVADQEELLDTIFRDHPRGVDARHDVWVGGNCIGVQGYILAKWIYDLTLTWTARRQEIIQAYRLPTHDLPVELAARAQEAEVSSIDIYTSEACPPVSYGSSPKFNLHRTSAR